MMLVPAEIEYWLEQSDTQSVIRHSAFWCYLMGAPLTSNRAMMTVTPLAEWVRRSRIARSILLHRAKCSSPMREDLRDFELGAREFPRAASYSRFGRPNVISAGPRTVRSGFGGTANCFCPCDRQLVWRNIRQHGERLGVEARLEDVARLGVRTGELGVDGLPPELIANHSANKRSRTCPSIA